MGSHSRRLRRVEVQLIENMLARTPHHHLVEGLAAATVIELDDPGCLRFVGSLMTPQSPVVIAERGFADSDGIAATATLSIDDAGHLLEFEAVRSDSSPVMSLRESLRKPVGPLRKALAGMRA